MRCRGLVKPAASRFARARSLPGSCAFSSLAWRSASFSAVVVPVTVELLVSVFFSGELRDAPAQVRTHGAYFGFIYNGKMIAM